MTADIDPKLDLVLERVIDVAPDLVWEAWTKPEHLKRWFTPAPWTVADCELDLRPGGIFRTVFRSPEGTDHDNVGCFLEIVPRRRLVFTDALVAGYRPSEKPFFTCVLTLEPEGDGTRYTAIALHGTEQNRLQHEEMGFYEGWGKTLDQLVEYSKTLA